MNFFGVFSMEEEADKCVSKSTVALPVLIDGQVFSMKEYFVTIETTLRPAFLICSIRFSKGCVLFSFEMRKVRNIKGVSLHWTIKKPIHSKHKTPPLIEIPL